MNVTQNPINLQHPLFKEHAFRVPLYQREYAWELIQVSDLFYDIENSNEDGHFLGSLLLFSPKEDKKVKEIIDGQQRITTIFLILHGVKQIFQKEKMNEATIAIDNFLFDRKVTPFSNDTSTELRLTTGKRDKRLFEAIIKGEETKDHIRKFKSHKLLLSALEDFICKTLETIKKEKGINGIIAFVEKVFNSKFIVMTAEETSDKMLLFKTLNARGMELSESDLIKNEICINVKQIPVEEAIEIWDNMREILEKYKVKVDNYLYHYINAQPYAQETRKNVDKIKPPTNLYPPVPEKYIFSVYEDKIKSITHTGDFLSDLKKTAENYSEFVNPVPEKIYLRSLREMGITKCYPLLIRGKNVLNDKNFDKLSQALECISFRHSIMRFDPKDLEKFYYTILDKLNSDNDLPEIIEEIKKQPTMTKHDKFKSEFINTTPSENISKVILQRIINRPGEEPFNFNARGIWLEHIMPKTPKGEWKVIFDKYGEEMYYDCVHRIGNLTFIQSKKNIGASNNDFVEKKKIYTTSSIPMTKDLVSYSKWDGDTITERQEKIYELAKDIWTL